MTETEPLPRRSLIRRLVAFLVVYMLVNTVVAVALVVWAWTGFARGLPELRGWHVDAPESEFEAGDDDDLDAYLAREEVVFAELKRLVDEEWSEQSGKESTALYSRFSATSISNPENTLERNWNRSFLLEHAEPIGCALLLHGLSDSPYSLRAIGLRLHAEGWTVLGLRVPGHGTCPGALARVDDRDWRAAAKLGARGLRDRSPAGVPLVVLGYSNGGALALDYAISSLDDVDLPRPSALVLFSPMVGISSLAPITRLHSPIRWLSGEERADWSGIAAEIDPFKYGSWPMNASVQASAMTGHVRTGIDRLERAGRLDELPPILAMQSAVDSTVIVPRLISEIFARLPNDRSELVLFDVNRAAWIGNLVSHSFERDVVPPLEAAGRPYELAIVTNLSPATNAVGILRASVDARGSKPLGLSWPPDLFSLSHGAIPFREDDPVYGTSDATKATRLPLGSITMRGESGVLQISDGTMLRVRHNPFYAFLEDHVVAWLDERTGPGAARNGDDAEGDS